jgi:hypothetical protein
MHPFFVLTKQSSASSGLQSAGSFSLKDVLSTIGTSVSRDAGSSKGFERLKAHKQLPALRAALEAHQTRNSTRDVLARQANAA